MAQNPESPPVMVCNDSSLCGVALKNILGLQPFEIATLTLKRYCSYLLQSIILVIVNRQARDRPRPCMTLPKEMLKISLIMQILHYVPALSWSAWLHNYLICHFFCAPRWCMHVPLDAVFTGLGYVLMWTILTPWIHSKTLRSLIFMTESRLMIECTVILYHISAYHTSYI